MTEGTRVRWGGAAFVLGVVIFLLSRFRHLVGMPEAGLWLLIPAGFALWIFGLTAFRAHYGPHARGIGRTGLHLTLGGIALLTLGHLGLMLHLVGPEGARHVAGAGFIPVILGTFVLVVGAILFGLDAVRGDVLPRLRAAPLATGLIGLAWMVFAFDSRPDGDNPEAFLAMRTLFGMGWLVVALVFATDRSARRDATSEKPVQPARSGPTSGA